MVMISKTYFMKELSVGKLKIFVTCFLCYEMPLIFSHPFSLQASFPLARRGDFFVILGLKSSIYISFYLFLSQ